MTGARAEVNPGCVRRLSEVVACGARVAESVARVVDRVVALAPAGGCDKAGVAQAGECSYQAHDTMLWFALAVSVASERWWRAEPAWRRPSLASRTEWWR